MTEPRPDRPQIVALPPVILATFLALGWGLDWLWPVPVLQNGARVWGGLGLIGLAVAIVAAAIRQFARHRTAIDPREPASHLLTEGIYRYSRNPLYLSLILILIGISLIANAALMLVLVVPFAAVLRWGVIGPEEHYLQGRFGEAYRAYCRQVRRWL